MMYPLHWPSPAKLNLFLYINGRRNDGYHLLQTLFQFLDYGDTIRITPTIGGRIRLLNPIVGILDQENLALRAARLLQSQFWSRHDPKAPGVDIQLNKIIPIGSGLGGGSSNAATVLIALNKQWNCGLNLTSLANLGLILGADVPVFIQGMSSFAEGIGEKLIPTTLPERWYLVTTPPISITTKCIFNDPDLCRNEPKRSHDELMTVPFRNAFEPIVTKRFFLIERYLTWLLKYAPSRLTGTGSCVFSEFDTEITARQILSKIPGWMRGFVARGVNLSPLHRILL